MFVHYELHNTSTRKNEVNNILIEVFNTLNSTLIGTARMNSVNDIYVELPEVTGRYRLTKKAIRQLEAKNITSLADIVSKSWLLSNGAWIMLNLEKAEV